MENIEVLKLIKNELEKLKPKENILENIKKECRNFEDSKKNNASSSVKKMRSFGLIFSAAASVIAVIFLAVFSISGFFKGAGIDGTKGLEYNLVDNSFYEVSIGKAAKKDITIASEYKKLPVKRIAKTGFMNTDVKSVNIPDSITSIDGKTVSNSDELKEGAFYGCSNLKSIILSGNLVSIGDGAFAYCESLENIIIPDSVEVIGSGAFLNCSSLVEVIIPSGVTVIGSKAFANCEKLTIYTETLNKEGWSDDWNGGSSVVQTDAYNLTYTLIDGKFYEVSKGSLTAAEIVIPGVYNGLPVMSISDNAFDGCADIISIAIPDSIINIGRHAFRSCSSLEDIIIPNSVLSIGDGTFTHCGNLKSVVMPVSVTSIGTDMFAYCDNLKNITMPDSLESICNYAFFDCKSLKSIILPEGITSIGASAFANCFGLEKILIPDSIQNIGAGAFVKCENLAIYTKVSVKPDGWADDWNGTCPVEWGKTPVEMADLIYELINNDSEYEVSKGSGTASNIIIPEFYNGLPVTAIADYAFCASNIESIIIPLSITRIGDYAFYGCYGLKSVTLSSSIINIGSKTFTKCGSLTIYIESEAMKEEWDKEWKDSDCFVVGECTLSEDKTYVISFIKTNSVTSNTYRAPYRAGYIFTGWAEYDGGPKIYDASDIKKTATGRTLYALWEMIEIFQD